MKPVRLLSVTILFVAVWFNLSSPAQTPAPAQPNVVATERFLVIVETSAVMEKRAENAQRMVGSVIASGLKGQMPASCTVGLWTFNDQLYAGQVPLQLWTPDNRQRVASQLAQYLQQQKQEKAGRVNVIWPALTNVVANSEHLTVLLVTSGSEAVQGTPFDAEIAESFSKNADQQRKNNMPFLTILRAAKGKFVTFAVNMPPWPLEVPEYPEEFKPVPPPAPVQPKTVTSPPVPPRPNPNVLAPTNVIYLVETSPPVAVATTTPAPQTPATEVVTTTPEPPKAVNTNTAGTVAPTQDKSSSAAVLGGESTPATHATPGPVPSKTLVIPILAVGICVLVGLLIVILALLRRSRRSTGESLITRSMNDR